MKTVESYLGISITCTIYSRWHWVYVVPGMWYPMPEIHTRVQLAFLPLSCTPLQINVERMQGRHVQQEVVRQERHQRHPCQHQEHRREPEMEPTATREGQPRGRRRNNR